MKDLPTHVTSKHVDTRRPVRRHRLEREHIHLTLLEEASRGWDDVEAGRLLSVAETRAKYKKSRSR